MKQHAWKLDFNFNEHGIVCNISLIGNTQAIQVGLQMAYAIVRDKFQTLLNSGKADIGLLPDFLIVAEVQKGNIQPYNGKFLKIEKLKTAPKGLVSSTSIKW